MDEEGEEKGLTFSYSWNPPNRCLRSGDEQQGLVGIAAALRDQRESSRKLDKIFSFRHP
jgi:hypothetical protein